MDIPHPEQFLDATRKDGWTPELKARFLALLAENGNVRLCIRRCGLSPQSAYVQRRRDPLFARGWAAALVLALDHAEQVLADRAIEGIEEEVWYRGELIGTKRRYDTRLLLAHLARLDRQAESRSASHDAGRFDELVALVAGERVPEGLTAAEKELPPLRTACGEAAGAAARAAMIADYTDDDFVDEDSPEAEDAMSYEDYLAILDESREAARAKALAAWDAWRGAAFAAVDGLALQDSINPSTSGAAIPLRHGEGDHPQDGGGAPSAN